MATRLLRDPTTVRRAQATLELALDVLGTDALARLTEAAELEMAQQAGEADDEERAA